LAIKGAFTPKPVRTVACSKNGKIDGMKVDPGCSGLTLCSRFNGAMRTYLFRYMIAGKARTLTIGSLDVVTLADAHAKVKTWQAMLEKGIDPAPKAAPGHANPTVITFGQNVTACYAHNERAWDVFHGYNWLTSLKTHAQPLFDRKTASITTADIFDVVNPVYLRTPETGLRVLSRIRQVFEFVLDHQDEGKERITANPAIRVRKRLARGVRKDEVPHPCVPWRKMPEFVAWLRGINKIEAKALLFLIFTCTPRRDEVVGAKWTEIDLDERVWRVPAERVKSGKPRLVPLSDAAIDVLNTLPGPDVSPYLFPAGRFPLGRWIDEAEYQQFSGIMERDLMQKMLRKQKDLPLLIDPEQNRLVHVHGTRRSFRAWSTNVLRDGYNKATEICLDHKTGKGTEEATYDDPVIQDVRREIADRWAESQW
jgi:integrase